MILCVLLRSSQTELSTAAQIQLICELGWKWSSQITRRSDAVFIEIGKSAQLFPAEFIIDAMKTHLQMVRLETSLGLGTDVSAAYLSAYHHILQPAQSFSLTKQSFIIESRPVADLCELVDPFEHDMIARKYLERMCTKLVELGVRTIGEFKKLPIAELSSRFGPIGLLAHERAHLRASPLWKLWKPEPALEQKTEFPYFDFYGELEPVFFELKKHLDYIFQILQLRDQKLQKLRVRIFNETTSQTPKPYREYLFDFLFPQSVTKSCLQIIRERLVKDFDQNPAKSPIEAVETRVIESVLDSARQRHLMDTSTEIQEQKMSLLARLSEKYGKDRIFFAKLEEDLRPERSWSKTLKSVTSDPRIVSRIPTRPTHLIYPLPIQVTQEFIHIQKQAHRICAWHMWPERVNGGWQERPVDENGQARLLNTYARDYSIVELEGERRIFIFQNTEDQKFYLHGYFG